jgi:methanol metabolism-related c-type cytochrome
MRSATPLLALAMLVAGAAYAQDAAEGSVDTAAAETDGVRWFNAEGIPTYEVSEDGTVDWPTFSGYRRYHAECHVCHGPDGEGSTYAPALKESVMRMDYYDFTAVVASGRQVVNASDNQVMPAFGTNPNVMCYLDDIWTYLLARGEDAVPRGRPAKRADKSEAYAEAEKSCMEP